MTLPADVLNVLDCIRELGFVSVQDGRVSGVPPLGPTPVANRWLPTLNYIRDYATQHHNWEGEYFVCIHDGWREYSRFVEESARRYLPWEHIGHAKFLGVGSCGEPRFRHRSKDHTIYPELPRKILSYCRHVGDRNTLLIPDVEFLETGFRDFLRQVKDSDLRWERKSSKVIWRGSKFSAVHARSDGDEPNTVHPRAEAVALSGHPEFKTILDASFAPTPIAEMLKYRYQLDLDGMVNAWSALFWKLSSNSLVLKPKSHWEQWYYDRLLPGHHYVPLASVAAVKDIFPCCEEAQAACRMIVGEANKLMATLTYEHAVSDYNIR